MNVAPPNNIQPIEAGETYLSIKVVNGNLIVVDQNGDMVNGLISCTAKTSVDCITEITLTASSYDNEPK